MVTVNNTADYITGVKLFDKLQCSLERAKAARGVKLFFVSCRSLGSHSECLCGSSYGNAVEHCGLKNYGGCVIHNSRILAAHNTCHGNRLIFVGYNKHFGF